MLIERERERKRESERERERERDRDRESERERESCSSWSPLPCSADKACTGQTPDTNISHSYSLSLSLLTLIPAGHCQVRLLLCHTDTNNGRKAMFYLTTHSTYFIYGYMASDMVKDHSDSEGAGCSSVDSMPAFEVVGRRIDPSQWTQLQFGLFSVPTSGPQLVYQRPWYVLFCLWKSAYKRSLAAYRKE